MGKKKGRKKSQGWLIRLYRKFFVVESDDIRDHRQNWLAILFFGCIALVLFRVVSIQYFEADAHEQRKNNQSYGVHILKSQRGSIYDCNGKVLVSAASRYTLLCSPYQILHPAAENDAAFEKYMKVLPPILHMTQDEFERIILENKNTTHMILAKDLSSTEAEELQKARREYSLGAIWTEEGAQRFYPHKDLAAQVIGLVNEADEELVDEVYGNKKSYKQDHGVTGVELIMDDVLRGQVKMKRYIKDLDGNPILHDALVGLVPEQSKSIKLTLDLEVQYYAERALNKAMKSTKAKAASIVIMDAKTGGILAMASRPTYMPVDRSNWSEESSRLRPVIDVYEPGSTFKPIIAAAALDSGKWKSDTTYVDEGKIDIGPNYIKNWDGEGRGTVSIVEILKYSLNTGMVKMGLTAGKDVVISYLKGFGFGKETGIEIPGEAAGFFPPEDELDRDITIGTLSIGQAVAVTQLQMVQAFDAFANDGVMMKPHIIKEIVNPDGTVAQEEKIEAVGSPVKKEVVDKINSILQREMYDDDGGGRLARVDGYRFAGKTGTAEKLDQEHGGYMTDHYIASFIGYGPFPQPRFIIMIVVDDPEGFYYGSMVAAPLFKEVASQLVRYYHIPPNYKKQETESDKEKARDIQSGDIVVAQTDTGEIIVPDFTGWSMGEVQEWMRKAHVRFQPDGSGWAISQSVEGGSAVEEHSTIAVTFGM